LNRTACSLAFAAALVFAAGLPALAEVDPIDTKTIPHRQVSSICRLPDGTYMLGGGRPIGEQSWETEPSVSIYGGTRGENIYNVDGLDVSNVPEGAVSSFAFECVEEVEVKTGGFEAEYGGMGSILDYRNGGTGVVSIITKSGGNEYRSAFHSHVDESLNDLTYDEAGTLWGAGNDFEATGPIPVLGYFDENGTFVRVDNPLETLGGFFNGVEFMGIPIAFGNTLPSGVMTRPLMVISPDGGRTWEAPVGLPWTYGTIDTATFLDPLHGWVGGETPDGGAFSYTVDGGKTWIKQTMPDATYIWDLEVAAIWPTCESLGTFGDPLSTPYIAEPLVFGAALGTHYLGDSSKESIVYRTVDGITWEELWRVDGYGGDVYFSYRGDGEVAIVQNGLDGNATFSRYAAHDFFGTENLICCGEIEIPSEPVQLNEPVIMQLRLYGPWGGTIEQDTVIWSADYGELVVDPNDPMQATFTAPEGIEATVKCTLSDRARDIEILRRMGIESEY